MYQCSAAHTIAAQGANDYTRVLRESASARELFLSLYSTEKTTRNSTQKPIRIFNVQRCFVGVSAEMVFEEMDIAANPRRLFDETASYINEQLMDFLFFHAPSDSYHLFNLRAVRLVAANYPAYFPAEVGTDTRAWLEQNWCMWADGYEENCIRYGLLSGFPLGAVLRFAEHKRTGQRLSLEQVVFSPVTHLSYGGFEPEKDAAYMRQLDEIFMESKIKW